MQRNHSTTDTSIAKQLGLARQIAYHEAGHAVAVYLRNKQQQLPPVYFQITLRDCAQAGELNYLAKVEGGRLIENLPHSLAHLSEADKQAYLVAFEADIVNLLAGPLAEAKYVARRDGEAMNRQLVNYQALGFYGGASDMEMVDDYIQCFMQNMQQRSEKIEQLFLEAFKFIENPLHWRVIAMLAQHIVHAQKREIPCTEIIAVIEDALQEQEYAWFCKSNAIDMHCSY